MLLVLHAYGPWATTRGQEARLEVNEMRMLRWMCGVTRRDKIRNENIRGTTRLVQASKKITEKRLKWCGHVRRMKEEHIVRRRLDVDISGKQRRGRPNLRWKNVCKKDMAETGLKDDNTTNRAAWRIPSLALPATPDDGTSQGQRGRRIRHLYSPRKRSRFMRESSWTCWG